MPFEQGVYIVYEIIGFSWRIVLSAKRLRTKCSVGERLMGNTYCWANGYGSNDYQQNVPEPSLIQTLPLASKKHTFFSQTFTSINLYNTATREVCTPNIGSFLASSQQLQFICKITPIHTRRHNLALQFLTYLLMKFKGALTILDL